ncbi:MAG TPA: right-handed parallel beta-helix repeat-containing protein, partial [Thermoanaerobaculia bacterium]|nr:right-handed parallel beta-helix repeat-containing protein [Thermoanaerobaculia bacterium]
SVLGAGILYPDTSHITVDSNGDGTPDATYDLPVEIQPIGGGAYSTDARLSPTEKTLYTIKTPGSAPVPGCNSGDARVYFHDLGVPPSGITGLNPGGTCIAGPISAGPLFNDLSVTSTIRTAIVVGAAPAVPSTTAVLWVDLVHGGSNLDTLNYVTNVEPTAGGIQFAPSGNAAYIQHGSNTATPKYTLVDLCVSPIAAAGSLATGDLPPGVPSAWVIPGAGAGTYIAEVRINGSPLLTSRVNLSVCQTSSGPPPTLTVNDAGDTLHATQAPCVNPGTGPCTLRDGLTYANAHPSSTIHFDIPGGGVHTISPATALPTITAPMTIDGYTQPGASPNSNPPEAGTNAAIKIEIDGGNHHFEGLLVSAGHVTIRGLAINRMSNAITVTVGGAVIAGNFLGTDASGTVVKANSNDGVVATASLIGGPSPADRNVISGNNNHPVIGDALVIQGNLIGLNSAGTAALGNGDDVAVSPGSLVGGTTPGERNVIAGTASGEAIGAGSSTTISGNYLGVDVTGSTSFSAYDGVLIVGNGSTLGGTSGTSPGGACTGACNLISSDFAQVIIGGSGNVVAGNVIGLNAAGTAALGTRSPTCIRVGNATGVVIGGASPSARNVISNCFYGIEVDNSQNTTISGNFLGTDSAGSTAPLPIAAGSQGIVITTSDGTIIGGTAGVTPGGDCTGACNVIAGWDTGIVWPSTGGSSVLVEGNHIGGGLTAATALPNTTGVSVFSSGATIGGAAPAAGNLIANNASAAVAVNGGTGTLIQNNSILGNGHGSGIGIVYHDGILISGGTGTTITQNSIFGNGGLGIDLPPSAGFGMPTANDACDADSGANDLQNFPVITSASSSAGTTTIAGTLNSTAGSAFTVDFYASPSCSSKGYGEGKIYLGSTVVTTDGSCNGAFNASLPVAAAAGSYITATATNSNGSTSEFSQCFHMTGGSPVPTQLFTMTPCRIVDTRNPAGPLGGPALAGGSDRVFVLAGHCGIPLSAAAVSVNVTITQPTAAGDLRSYPGGSTRPLVSTINYQPGQTRANNAVVALGTAGDLAVRCDQGSGTVQLIIDATGYFQ